MPTEVHTICFHTRDAVERDDSRLVFEMPLHRLRTPAMKVALGSVEFPMVQWTVEDDWSRLYLNEGIRLPPGGNALEVTVRGADRTDPERPTVLGVPARLNRVAAVRRSSGAVVFECAAPHHLWASDARACLVPLLAAHGCDVRIVSSATGDVSLVTAHEDGHLRRVSDVAFAIACDQVHAAVGTVVGDEQPTFVYVSAIPSPACLCKLLTLAARGAQLHSARGERGGGAEAVAQVGQELSFEYDAAADHVAVTTRLARGSLVRILPTPLAQLLGVTTTSIRIQADGEVLPCGPTNLWDYARVPSGFYAPCHRPMCTGQPMRFGTEMEAAINRLYFPLPASNDARLQASPSTPHALVFVDPLGATHMCPIPVGRYSPHQLSTHLEAEMSRVSGRGVSFSVSFEADRFAFVCERQRADGRVVPAPFSLLFNHPLSIEAARLGFPALPCVGSASYTSAEAVHVPRSDLGLGDEPRHWSTLVRVGEIGSQKRFRVHAVSPPVMTAVVCEGAGGRYVLRTHVNRYPYAHGYQAGDVVRLFACDAAVHVLEPVNAAATEWSEREYAASAPPPHETTAVVVSALPDNPCALVLYMPPVVDVGTCINVATPTPDPFNLCFSASRAKGLDAYMLGFPERSVQWGIDGSVRGGGGSGASAAAVWLPPFDAPYSHALDHPDYVLITLNESSSASLEHSYNGESRSVFCKLSLYPLFREERMLPRDAMLQRSTFSRFEIAFWNPDMKRPYRFHGAEFSFSLNFVSATPGE